MDEELLHHVLETMDRLVDQGWDREEARAEAERRFGDLKRWRAETLAQHVDHMRRKRMMDGMKLMIDQVRYAMRSLRGAPAFAWTFVLTLALGIGATGAIFSVIDTVLLRPLPFDEPERIVEVDLRTGDGLRTDLRQSQWSVWRESAVFLETLAAYTRLSMVEERESGGESVGAIVVEHTLDEVLGVHAELGRLFGPDDAIPGSRTLVLSASAWARRGSNPDVIGSELVLDGESWTVIGVLPPGVKYPITGASDLWIPLADDGSAAGHPVNRLSMIGRLADGVDLPTSEERAEAVSRAMEEDGLVRPDWSIGLRAVSDWRANSDVKLGLYVVSGAVGLMFLIAIVNAINLLLVRSSDRAREISVRRALGASRRQVIQQVFTESIVLALVGGILATGVAALCVAGVRAIAPEELTFGMVYDFGMEGRSLLVVFLAAVTAGILVAPLPALGAVTASMSGVTSHSGRSRTRAAFRLRGALVASQIGLSVVLLIGAGLFLRSFSAMIHQDLGMEPDRVALAMISLPDRGYDSAVERREFVDRVLERLGALPGVESAVVSLGVPPSGGSIIFGSGLQGEGFDVIPGEHVLPYAEVPEQYLRTLGAELVYGRELTAEDVMDRGVMVDVDMAMLVFGRANVVGERLRLSEDDEWRSVVGVVKEHRLGGLDDRIGNTAVLAPMDPESPPSFLSFTVRSSDPGALLPAIRASIVEVDATLPLFFLGTGEDALGEEAGRPQFLVVLMSVLAAIAVALAAVGVYGVLSFVVRRREREMGIRIALGAPLGRVHREVLGWGLRAAALGIALGLLVASRLDDAIEGLLFQTEPGDLFTRGVVVLTLTSVVVLACLLPARRATRCDPVETLKSDLG